MRKVFFILLVSMAFVWQPCSAQMTEMSQVRRNLATIIFCGLGGAVVGISTLSFYGQPQEHTSNITTGFALGVIGGTIYTTTHSVQLASQLKPHPVQLAFGWEF